jgi:hypothetical protein
VPKAYKKALDKFLKIEQLNDCLSSTTDRLSFKAQFSPFKPFKFTFDIVIIESEGGRWRKKVLVESLEPDPDDFIEI